MNKRLEMVVLVGLFLLSVAVRWYQLPEHLFFGFEQGRDALIIQSIAQLEDFVLVGPKTDIGGIFHGAWYYYLMVVPYALGQGNPLVASGFLILMTSLTPIIMYYLLKRMTGSVSGGVLAGLVTALSFEFITYSRWLSNVTPAVPLVALAFFGLWQYRQTTAGKYFVLAALAAAMSAQFEIILALWWGLIFGCLLLFRAIKWPSWSSWGLSILGTGVIFAPMVLFNLRNDFISIRSAITYTAGEEAHQGSGTLLENLTAYSQLLARLIRVTLFNLGEIPAFVGALLMIGIVAMKPPKTIRHQLLFFGLWTLMTLPVMLFPRSLRLTQIYLGSGLGLIGWWVIAVRTYWLKPATRFLAVALVLLVAASALRNLYLLHTNQETFFVTIQDDLNYRDQTALLAYVHTDAQGLPYQLKAFTIPYFQEEGWRYLHSYHYPQDTAEGAEYIYVVIEKNVDPFWVARWTTELGETELISEQKFGKLTVQKRRL